MPLPTLPTTKDIRDRIVSDIESKINQSTPLLAKAFNRVLATALAFVFTLLYKFGQWAYKQIFTVTQGTESLELKGEQYNILRKASVAAVHTMNITGQNGRSVNQGTQYRASANGLVYTTNTTVTILAGSIPVDVTCATTGEVGTLFNGDTLTILSPVTGIDNEAIVTATVIDGEDQEPIEEYRARIQEREKRPPQGGALIDYILWAKEVPGVTRAFAYGKREVPGITAGYVFVFPLTDNEASRIPTAPKLVEVHDYIDDPTRAPLQVPVIEVNAMVEVEFTVDVTALDPDTSEVRNAFTSNLTDFLFDREPQQFADQLDVKNVISRSFIESIGIQSGANSITLTFEITGTGTPIESYTLDYNELAKLVIIGFP